MSALDAQRESAGISADPITDAAIAAAEPRPGLSWLDVGCGRGDALRKVLERHEPERLAGVDVVDFLADDLRDRVDYRVGPAETALPSEPVDRVLLIEVLEHLEAPWTVLREAARLVAPGGMLVATTPNITSIRHRLELVLRGELSTFRSNYAPHLTPILPHVTTRILEEEGLVAAPPFFAGPDVIPKTPRTWPEGLRRRLPSLTSLAVGVVASRPLEGTA